MTCEILYTFLGIKIIGINLRSSPSLCHSRVSINTRPPKEWRDPVIPPRFRAGFHCVAIAELRDSIPARVKVVFYLTPKSYMTHGEQIGTGSIKIIQLPI